MGGALTPRRRLGGRLRRLGAQGGQFFKAEVQRLDAKATPLKPWLTINMLNASIVTNSAHALSNLYDGKHESSDYAISYSSKCWLILLEFNRNLPKIIILSNNI
jgi:hypothetical protein